MIPALDACVDIYGSIIWLTVLIVCVFTFVEFLYGSMVTVNQKN
jgi:hypothetical protein